MSNNTTDNPDNLPETEILDADADLLQKAADAAVSDGEIDESVELDRAHQKAREEYLLAREKQKENQE